MGHHIEAMITKGEINSEIAKSFGLPFFYHNGFTIVALFASHIDFWGDKLGIEHDSVGEIICDCSVSHYFAKNLELNKYAIIMTEYFGGIGEQYASVYSEGETIMPETKDGINEALRKIGVVRANNKDEFDTICLGNYRSFDEYFGD
ncbi:hypothetical protein [Sessilibacter sp. MAH4]